MPKRPYSKFVFSTAQTTRYRFPTHSARLVMDRSQAETSEAFLVVLEPGEAPPPHAHSDTEQVFYVLKGAGELEIDSSARFPVQGSDLVRIPPNTHHRMLCRSTEPLVYLAVDCFLGGRPADEPTWEEHLRNVCAQNKWEFANVREDKPGKAPHE